MNKLRIILAEDHKTVREGIKMLINSQPDMEIIGEAGDGAAAVKMSEALNPDIVILDVSMPEMNGLKATKSLKQCCPKVKSLTLTRHTDDGYLQQLIQAGSSGYVLKQSAATELIRAIRIISQGDSYIDPTLTEKVMGGYIRQSNALRGAKKIELTDRETEITKLIAWGYSNKDIAEKLLISVKTVEAHKANVMTKLNANSRIDIVRYAVLQGWLQDN